MLFKYQLYNLSLTFQLGQKKKKFSDSVNFETLSKLWQDFPEIRIRMDAVWPPVWMPSMDGFDKK